MKSIFTIAPGTEDEQQAAIEKRADGLYTITLDPNEDSARTFEVDACRFESGALNLIVEGHSHDIDVAQGDNDTWHLNVAGTTYVRRVLDERRLRMLQATGEGLSNDAPDMETPMAGKVIEVMVTSGQAVEADDPIVVVEAMKMENVLKAHRSGVVSSINVSAGDTVDIGDVLLSIHDPE